MFATIVLLADALVGDRGLVASTRARLQFNELSSSVDRLRRENHGLRETAHRLREDRTTIEGVARKELGLIRPGEIMVYIHDIKPPAK